MLLHSFHASLTAIFLLLVCWVTLFQRLVTPARGLDSSQQGNSTSSCETFAEEKMTIDFWLKTASRHQLSDPWCRWYDHDWPTGDHSSDNRNSYQDFLDVLSRVSIANFHREFPSWISGYADSCAIIWREQHLEPVFSSCSTSKELSNGEPTITKRNCSINYSPEDFRLNSFRCQLSSLEQVYCVSPSFVVTLRISNFAKCFC